MTVSSTVDGKLVECLKSKLCGKMGLYSKYVRRFVQ